MLSVIVSTYNRAPALRLVLEGILCQAQGAGDFEVIVADDGSGPDTAAVVEAFRARAPFRVEHVWQENRGFRAARVRNLGAKAARGTRILFLDGDCVPLPGFLAAHRPRPRHEHHVFIGDRMVLDREPSATLTAEAIASGGLGAALPGVERRRLRWRAIKTGFYLFFPHSHRPRLVTANLSLPRAVFEDVNGLDERFTGWGLEDDDLRRRLRRRGHRFRNVLRQAEVCHLWHEPVPSFPGRVRDGVNQEYFRRGYFLARCRHGLRARPLAECRIAWNGEGPAEGKIWEISIGWGARPKWLPSEIRVYVATPAPTGLGRGPTPEIWLAAPGAPPPPRWHGRAARVEATAPLDPASAAGRAQILGALEAHV